MAGNRIRGISVTVDETGAAGAVLLGLGLERFSGPRGHGSIWVAGRHFIELREGPASEAGGSARAIYVSADGFDLGAVSFRQWSEIEPLRRAVGNSAIGGIDHVITMVESVDAGSRILRDRDAFTRAEAVWTFPALSTRAQMFLMGDGYVELNEPSGSGAPAWAAASGIVGLVLEAGDVGEFRAAHPQAALSRISEVKASRPGEELQSLGLVSLVKTRAFGDFQIYVFEPRLR